MLDRVLAVLSMAGLIAFTGVVVVFVREPDLTVVVVLCLLMGVYDFWTTLRARTGAGGKENPDG